MRAPRLQPCTTPRKRSLSVLLHLTMIGMMLATIPGCNYVLLLGYLIVHNINTLHDWLGKALGVKIWDPELYIFDTIPNTLEPTKVVWICSIAVLSSIASARRRFSRPFSASRDLSLRASETSSPPYFAFHL